MKRKVRIDDGMGPAFYVDEDEAARGGATTNGVALIVVTLIGIVLTLLGVGGAQ